jgi:hypothetical protein
VATLGGRTLPSWDRLRGGGDWRAAAAWNVVVGAKLVGPAGALAMILLVGVASVPLARHLWHTPSGFPEHIPQRTVYQDAPADRFATRWASSRTSQTTSKELG